MFKIIALMTICVVYGVVSSPTVLYSRPLVVQKDSTDVGIANLGEKASPGIESQQPISVPIHDHHKSLSPPRGTKNNAEKAQIEPRKGSANLNEKEIPQDVLDKYYRSH